MKDDNELIAEFMGAQLIKEDNYFKWKFSDDSKCATWGNLPYNTSWDWLMPVLDHIQKLRIEIANGLGFEFMYTIESGRCIIDCRIRPTGEKWPPFIMCEADSTIEATHMAVCAFIKYYNTKQQEQKQL